MKNKRFTNRNEQINTHNEHVATSSKVMFINIIVISHGQRGNELYDGFSLHFWILCTAISGCMQYAAYHIR